MPRKARVIVAGIPHHIVQRGHNRKAVFVEADDYCYYLDNLRERKLTLGIRVYSFSLMTNHILSVSSTFRGKWLYLSYSASMNYF